MSFNSITFLLFFPITILLFYLLRNPYRWYMVLVASCIFYMFFIPKYVLILFLLIAIDYTAGLLMDKTKKRKLILLVSIITNLGILFLFKYFNFFNENIAELAKLIHWSYSLETLSLILPIGLSFHTFQSLSYVVEVYKKNWKPEKNIFKYALYVMYFPQLVAGPIERPQHVLPQLFTTVKFNSDNMLSGLQRILLGLFKKVVIADRLALVVNQVYSTPHDYIGFPLVLATVCFAFQIYFDFSGYTDIALGAAKTMNIKLMENFQSPYLARSISDFWRRWHISLYSWFRDYVYIPLGGNRVSLLRQSLNIFIVFLLSGLWHGASWTYIVWGCIHGGYIIIATLWSKTKMSRLESPISSVFLVPLQIVLTFILVSIAWVFFRANSISDALYILSHSMKGYGSIIKSIFHFDWYPVILYATKQGAGLGLPNEEILLAFGAIFIIGISGFLKRKIGTAGYVQWVVYLLLGLMVLNFGVGDRTPFIYFQF